MRTRQSLASVAACSALAGLAGCGAGGAPPTPKVSLSITAPTSGATVGVRQITVTGNVSPTTATVVVGGQPAQVVKGSFKRALQIARANETIEVTASASGYRPVSAITKIGYSRALAAQLAASRPTQPQPVATPPNPFRVVPVRTAPQLNGAAAKALNSAFALPSSPKTTSPSPTPTNPTSTTPSPTPSPSPGSSPTSPSSPPTLTVAAIKQLWITGCVKAGKNGNYTPYCTCTYTHLEKNGALSSRARLLALVKKLLPFQRTHDPSKLPRFVRNAISACVAQLPPLDPLTGKPVITKLSGLSYRRAPVPKFPKLHIIG
jgi:hypothetical protein